MTETLTYNPTPADAPELNDEEKNSLEVAEKLGQEENDLILGKFKNAEELEKAYVELEKKQGTEDEAEQDVEDKSEEMSPAAELITSASDEYFSNEGKLSPETMEKFTQMSSKDLVDAYMNLQSQNPDVQSNIGPAADLTDGEVNSIHNSVGGEAAYNNLLQWAANNVEESKIDAFNTLINSGNATAIQLAVNGLKSEYETANGYEGRMLSGKAARTTDGFRSQAEVVQAMSDPRYEKDPAYRQDVYDKLERSNVAF